MLYEKVKRMLKDRINTGVYTIGSALPTEVKLIEEYNVSRITIRKAIDELVKLNLVEKRRGSGTYVLATEHSYEMRRMTGTTEIQASYNKVVKYKVLRFSMITDNVSINKVLEVHKSEPIYYIRRVKYIDDMPIIVEDSYMPVYLFPDLNISTLEKPKFDYVEHTKGMVIEGSRKEFAAVTPDKDIMEMLRMVKNSPVLKLSSVSNIKNGPIFDYTEGWFHPNAHRLSIYLAR